MLTAFLIIILILLIYYVYKIIRVKYDRFSIEYNTSMYTDIDGRKYFVHNKHEDMQIAANTFAELNKITTDVINFIYERYHFDNTAVNKKRKEVADLLMARYDVNNLRENSPLNIQHDTSYTINKGDIIAICLRSSKQYNQIHDINTITFVVLHEITHLAITSYDHPDEFWEVFKFILIEAEIGGFYKSPDFEHNPKEYCGININYNPRYDITIPDI